MLTDGDSTSKSWRLDIYVRYRDIEDPGGSKESSSQSKRPSKTQAKSGQRERREKGNRYALGLGGENDLD
ncbi:hypothetical protein BJX65DRAFT_276581 [Aspergillus insuetus]